MLLLGLLLSAAIETTQLFERERFSSVIDVITNGMGAALGTIVLRSTMRRIRSNARLVGRLSLEIPLMGLIYLLVPLLLVASLSAVVDPLRTIALIPLGLIGARLMGAVQQNHFGPNGLFGRATMGVVAAGWMVLGTFPVLLRHPLVGASLVGLVGVATWHESAPGAGSRGSGATLRGRHAAQPHTVRHRVLHRGRLPSAGHGHRRVALRARSHRAQGTTSISSSYDSSSRWRR